MVYAKSYQRITWRDTWGTAKTLCNPDGFPVPSYVTVYLRCQEIDLKPLLGPGVDTESDPIDFPEEDAIDDTGLKEKGPGEWRKKIYHPKKHRQWLKFHAFINTYNRKIRTSPFWFFNQRKTLCKKVNLPISTKTWHKKNIWGWRV